MNNQHVTILSGNGNKKNLYGLYKTLNKDKCFLGGVTSEISNNLNKHTWSKKLKTYHYYLSIKNCDRFSFMISQSRDLLFAFWQKKASLESSEDIFPFTFYAEYHLESLDWCTISQTIVSVCWITVSGVGIQWRLDGSLLEKLVCMVVIVTLYHC